MPRSPQQLPVSTFPHVKTWEEDEEDLKDPAQPVARAAPGGGAGGGKVQELGALIKAAAAGVERPKREYKTKRWLSFR